MHWNPLAIPIKIFKNIPNIITVSVHTKKSGSLRYLYIMTGHFSIMSTIATFPFHLPNILRTEALKDF
jgi:hypothetical protein